MAGPHTMQVVFCVRRFARREAGLDGANWKQPVKPSAAAWQPTRIHVCCNLDPRQGRLQMHALLQPVQSHQPPTSLPKMWLFGLQWMLQAASSDRSHSPHKEVEGLLSLPQEEGGDVSTERRHH